MSVAHDSEEGTARGEYLIIKKAELSSGDKNFCTPN